ncbi:hypothetical protein SAMN05444156_0447 [Verrucomicrobium sp. GAS474]|uniref:hypothetical protein n=1 Tax=Verrucomicrobium sp. GAS474 TaxID=1882831 RepID=UPI00087D00D6|nr:hypothetical protein [Verrucomicrobium sp. GAS474]SDT88812.1 hypothetical protein SAMN05444156_0447 [Verrucomicrobium sp. GAS474]
MSTEHSEGAGAAANEAIFGAPGARESGLRSAIAGGCGWVLALFLADAALSIVASAFSLAGSSFLSSLSGLLSLVALLAAAVTYGLSGLTPMIPKRLAYPLFFFYVAALLGELYRMCWTGHLASGSAWYYLVFSLVQGGLGLAVLKAVKGGEGAGALWSWPLCPGERITGQAFTWWNPAFFLAVSGLLAVGAVLFTVFCAGVGLSRSPLGPFMALHPGGLTMRAQTYTREADGKRIDLYPMIHVADAVFYRNVLAAIPPEELILTEGLQDRKKQLRSRGLDYRHAAKKLQLASQADAFVPQTARQQNADVDLSDFSPTSIVLVNRISDLFQNFTVAKMRGLQVPPAELQQLLYDIDTRRSAHLLAVIREELPGTDAIAVPWGAMHMVAVAQGLREEGFVLKETRELRYLAFPWASSVAANASR